jgi:hypothetical protein
MNSNFSFNFPVLQSFVPYGMMSSGRPYKKGKGLYFSSKKILQTFRRKK